MNLYDGEFKIIKSDLNNDGKSFNSDGNNKVFRGIINIIDEKYPEINPINKKLSK